MKRKNLLSYFVVLCLILIFSCIVPSTPVKEEDPESTILESIELLPSTIDGSGDVTIKIKLKNDMSADFFVVELYSPTRMNSWGGAVLYTSLTYNSASGCYEDTLRIENYHESGIWKIGEIYIEIGSEDYEYDIESDVSTTYYSVYDEDEWEYKKTDFPIDNQVNVINTNHDDINPTLVSIIDVTPDVINGSGLVSIIIDITDDGGSGLDVCWGGLSYFSQNSAHTTSTAFSYNGGTGYYELSISLDNDDENGTWYVHIGLEDNAGNTTEYYYDSDTSTQYFTVEYDYDWNEIETNIPIKTITKN